MFVKTFLQLMSSDDFICSCCCLKPLPTAHGVILASGSPRRKAIFSFLFPNSLDIIPSNFDEDSIVVDNPEDLVKLLSYHKALSVINSIRSSINNRIVVACDTLVFLGNKPLAKPANRDEAIQMLSMLSNKTHSVISGVTLAKSSPSGQLVTHSYSDVSSVTFKDLSHDQIASYVDSGECYDKAGGYGIQSPKGAQLVERYEGCYLNIVGFGVEKFSREFFNFINDL
ncbi:hypothetical protein RCL1_006015 [Eukaryota sp. TZLM3-RCL]